MTGPKTRSRPSICRAVRHLKLVWAMFYIVLCVLFFSTELRPYTTNAAPRYALFKSANSDGRGTLRELVTEIDARVPVKATRIAGNCKLGNAYYVLSRKTSIDLTTLRSPERRVVKADLVECFERRQPRINSSDVFILGRPEQISLPNDASEVFRDAGLGCAAKPDFILLKRWVSQTSDPEGIVLFNVCNSDWADIYRRERELWNETAANFQHHDASSNPSAGFSCRRPQ